jgi:hypothetical protein
MVTIVERLAMQIRSGPVRAIFPQGGNGKRRWKVINHDFVDRGRVIHSLAPPAFGGPFRSPMNNYWMTNNAMPFRRVQGPELVEGQRTAGRSALTRLLP